MHKLSSQRSPLNILYVLYRFKLTLFATIGVFICISIFYLRVADEKYTVQMILGPTDSKTDSLSKLSNLTPLLGLSLGQGNQKPIDQFKARIFSERIASKVEGRFHILKELTPALWDPKSNNWKEPDGVVSKISSVFYWLAGREIPPFDSEGARLRDIIEKSVKVKDFLDGPYTSISFEGKNPDSGKRLLQEIYDVTEEDMRNEKIEQMDKMISYIENKLSAVSQTEHRVALIQILSDLERDQMLASAHTAYAAVIVDAPESSVRPTSPKILVTMLVGVLAGVIAGIFLAIGRFQLELYSQRSDVPAAFVRRSQ